MNNLEANLVFQQEYDFAQLVWRYLNDRFTGHCIGSWGFIEGLTWSPDLTPSDISMGILKA